MMKIIALLAFSLATLLASYSLFAAEPRREFTPKNGFGGASEGNGTLKMFFGKPRQFHVVSNGREQSDGTFRLEQRVTFQGEPPQYRVWILTNVAPNRYSARLSDAAGPVTGSTSGARFSLQYRVKGPLAMTQELELLPDGKTINNVGTITLLGIPIGHLHETIKRRDPGLTSNNLLKPTPLRGAPKFRQ